MANRPNGTLYTGVTSDLPARTYQHRTGLIDGFTKEHGCTHLVWFEKHDDLQEARQRELQMKKWKRTWKIEPIEHNNPQWQGFVRNVVLSRPGLLLSQEHWQDGVRDG